MYCRKCGHEIAREGARFCSQCGAKLGDGAVINANLNAGSIAPGAEVAAFVAHEIKGDVLVFSSFSELDAVDKATRERLRREYEAQIARSPQAARYYLALGLSYLDLGLYPEALGAIYRACERAPQDAHTRYYLALAMVQGRALRTLPPSDVVEIERNIEAAIQLAPKHAHFWYFFALVKYEYHLFNDSATDVSEIGDLLLQAGELRVQRSEIVHLLSHVRISDSPIKYAMLDRL